MDDPDKRLASLIRQFPDDFAKIGVPSDSLDIDTQLRQDLLVYGNSFEYREGDIRIRLDPVKVFIGVGATIPAGLSYKMTASCKQCSDIKYAEKEKEDDRTMADLAKEALSVQEASDLSYVVHVFSCALARLRCLLDEEAEVRKKAGDRTPYCSIESHPICVLFADRLVGMAGGTHFALYDGNESAFTRSYKWAKEQCAQAAVKKMFTSLPREELDRLPRPSTEELQKALNKGRHR